MSGLLSASSEGPSIVRESENCFLYFSRQLPITQSRLEGLVAAGALGGLQHDELRELTVSKATRLLRLAAPLSAKSNRENMLHTAESYLGIIQACTKVMEDYNAFVKTETDLEDSGKDDKDRPAQSSIERNIDSILSQDDDQWKREDGMMQVLNQWNRIQGVYSHYLFSQALDGVLDGAMNSLVDMYRGNEVDIDERSHFETELTQAAAALKTLAWNPSLERIHSLKKRKENLRSRISLQHEDQVEQINAHYALSQDGEDHTAATTLLAWPKRAEAINGLRHKIAEKNILGMGQEPRFAYHEIGMLCNCDPAYAPIHSWQHFDCPSDIRYMAE